jgi:hypothetical protein
MEINMFKTTLGILVISAALVGCSKPYDYAGEYVLVKPGCVVPDLTDPKDAAYNDEVIIELVAEGVGEKIGFKSIVPDFQREDSMLPPFSIKAVVPTEDGEVLNLKHFKEKEDRSWLPDLPRVEITISMIPHPNKPDHILLTTFDLQAEGSGKAVQLDSLDEMRVAADYEKDSPICLRKIVNTVES